MIDRVVRVLRMVRWPVLRQLQLEEALLRADSGNWLVINDGAADPAIVLGISGKPERLINIPEAKRVGVQVVRRFSGGGTVIVDHDTLLVSLIMQHAALPASPPVDLYPKPLMRWSEGFYRPVFQGVHPGFSLQENDYAFGQLKFGGNAQYITKGRFLHHTSFLWDFDPVNMGCLTVPEKQPEYRRNRDHREFLTTLSAVGAGREGVLAGVEAALGAAGLVAVQEDAGEVEAQVLELHYQKSTRTVDL